MYMELQGIGFRIKHFSKIQPIRIHNFQCQMSYHQEFYFVLQSLSKGVPVEPKGSIIPQTRKNPINSVGSHDWPVKLEIKYKCSELAHETHH